MHDNIDVDYYVEDDQKNDTIMGAKEGEDKWRVLFDQYDPDGFGEVPIHMLSRLLRDGIKIGCITECDVVQVLEKIEQTKDDPDEHTQATITFQRLTELRTRKRSLSFKCALHERDKQILACLKETPLIVKKHDGTTQIDILSKCPKPYTTNFRHNHLVNMIAKEVLTNKADLKYFNSKSRGNISICNVKASAVFLPIVSFIQVFIFIYQLLIQEECIAQYLEFRYWKAWQIWRFFSYGLLYPSIAHLMLDISRQMTVGVALEIVYGSARIAHCYLTALFSAALAVSLFAPDKSLQLRGSSAGANSLLMGLLINWIMHKPPSNLAWLKMVVLLMITSLDFGLTVFENGEEWSGYLPFSCGLATGITLGYATLSTYEQNLKHQRRWWFVLAIEGIMLLTLLVYVSINKNKRLIT